MNDASEQHPVGQDAAPPEDSAASRLRARTGRDVTIQKILAGVAFVAVAGFVALVYMPSSRRLQSLTDRLSESAREVSEQEQRIAAMAGVSVAADELEIGLTAFRPLPERPMVEMFIREMTVLARRLDLRDFEYVRQAPPAPQLSALADAATRPQAQPMRITFVGRFVDAFDLLNQIERTPRMLRVKKLRIEAVDAPGATSADGEVRVELIVNLFYRPAPV